jgi:beta-glucanase (GH16 family)
MDISKLGLSRRQTLSVRISLGLALLALPFIMRAQAPANYSLAWSDNFAGVPLASGGTTLDTSKWWWRMGYSSNGSQQAVNVNLDGAGNLDLANTSKVVASKTYYSGGGVISHQTFRYGYFQVTAQTPANPSEFHTSFWLSAVGTPLVSWNPAPSTLFTEIDGFEINSTSPSSISSGWITWSGAGSNNTGGTRCNGNYNPGFNTSAGSHTYGIEWTESAITYYIDGASYCSQAYTPTQGPASPVNMWLTSIPYGATGTPTTGAQAVFATPEYYVRDYYVNSEDTGYAEYGSNWGTSSVAGFSSQAVRYTCTAGQYSTYTPNLLSAGNYDVQAYQIIDSGNMDTATVVTVNTSTGPVILPTGTLPSSGSNRWIDLGTYTFAAGNTSSVSLQDGNSCLRTSMVKFVRQ